MEGKARDRSVAVTRICEVWDKRVEGGKVGGQKRFGSFPIMTAGAVESLV